MGDNPDLPEIDREAVKRDFIAARGYWKDWTEQLLEYDPSFLALYARFGGHPAKAGPLKPLMCELVYVALDASATHLFVSGLKTHIRMALRLGATPAQIVEVLRIATGQGIDGYACGAAILLEEMESAGIPANVPDDNKADALRSAYASQLGAPAADAEAMLRVDPELFALICELLAAPPGNDGLDEHMRILIRIALSGCFLSFNAQRLRPLIRQALSIGCAPGEIAQVLQLTTHLAVHACSVGVPALTEVLGEAK